MDVVTTSTAKPQSAGANVSKLGIGKDWKKKGRQRNHSTTQKADTVPVDTSMYCGGRMLWFLEVMCLYVGEW